MKTAYYICLLFFALFIVSCEDKNSFVLKGKIKDLQRSEIYIVCGENLLVDNIRSNRFGKFRYRGNSQEVEPLIIYMKNGNVWTTLWVQNGEKYSLTGDVNCPEMMMVKGGKINELLTSFKTDNLSGIKEKCELNDKLNSLLDNHLESSASDDALLSSQLKNVDHILKTRAQDFVEANPSSIAALVMIQDYILDIENASDIQPFLNLVSEEVKTNPLYEKLQMLAMKDSQTKVGQPALDFKIIDTKNDTITLETFKDKYFILTFAKSQCDFCEPEYAELLTIRNTFPAKELAILTISLDENKEDWKVLAEEQGINWIQVIDTAGWASELVSRYNVLSVPCNYLIDKEGIIIASKVTVNDIQTILNDKLKTKN